MKKIFFGISFLLLSIVGRAQEDQCKLKGQLVDSLGLPAIDASVTAYNDKDEGMGYVFSDIDGFFELNLPCDQNYELEIEHVEFKSFIAKVNLNKKTLKEKYTLSRNNTSLKDLVIESRVPIKIKGDTIEYDAESFKTGTEENLEDILKKLPGIEVEDGKVFYEGKEITSIKVEGREIFGGNTKLLNKNLPSDAVDKIQLTKKLKQNPFANSLQDEEQPELNIVLKEDKKSLIFGNMSLGGDSDTHWDVQEKLFYFDETKDATLIGDYNTYGKQVFDRDDYYSFLGGMSELMQDGGEYYLRNSLDNISFGGGGNAAEMNELLGALHLGYEPNDKVYVNGFIMGDRNYMEYRSTSNRIFNTQDLNIFEESTNSNQIVTGLARIRLDYNPSSKSQVKYRINFNYQESDNESDVNTTTNGIDTGFRDIDENRVNYNLQQKLTYLRKIGEDDNLGIYFTHQFQQENPQWNVFSQVLPFPEFSNALEQGGIYNLFQDEFLHQNALQFLGIYNHLLTRTSNIRLKLGSNFTFQNFRNDVFSYETLLNNPLQQTDSDFDYKEYYADVNYTKKWDKLTLDIGATGLNINDKNIGNNGNYDLTGSYIFPHLEVKYEFSNSTYLSTNFNRSIATPSVRDVSNGLRIDSFYSLFSGSNQLQEQITDNAGINFGMFKTSSFFHLYAGINYSKVKDNIQTASFLTGATQVNTFINSPEKQENISGYLGGSKRFTRNYSIRFNANVNRSSFYSFVNGDLTDNNSFSQSYTLRNQFKFAKKFEITPRIRYTRNDYVAQNTSFINDNIFSNLDPSVEAAWSITKNLLFQGEYSYRFQYQNGNTINEAQTLDMSLRWKPRAGLYFYLVGGNLLNNDVIVSNGFSNNITSVSATEVLGKYFILRVKFKF